MAALAEFAWRRIKPLQWRVLRARHATFLVATQIVVRDDQGRVLLLRHRLWPPGREWGLPGGYANAGETLEDAARREVREETGLDVEVGRVVRIRSGFRFRVEVAFAGEARGGELRLDRREVLEARFLAPSQLPDAVMPEHRELIGRLAEWIEGGAFDCSGT
jgi:ADP-ribose pyrophosphatase YjhB (NUDIX family)